MGTVGSPTSPNGAEPLIHTHKVANTLVVENVTVVEVTKRIEVPQVVYIPVEQTKYITLEEQQTRYRDVLKDTIKYTVKEEQSIKYVPKEEFTMKYTVKEEETIKYIPIEKIVEIPVKKEIPLEVLTIKDREHLQALINAFPDLAFNSLTVLAQLKSMRTEMDAVLEHLKTLKDYKLVEEIVSVPHLEYHTVEVERVVWKDIPRNRTI